MGGTLVTAHCYTPEGMRQAIEGGVGGIEHGNLLDEDTAELLAKKGVFFVPTLAIHQVISQEPFKKMFKQNQLEKNEMVRQKGLLA
jgi:imidazolonepropionase-like amidohydrolase